MNNLNTVKVIAHLLYAYIWVNTSLQITDDLGLTKLWDEIKNYLSYMYLKITFE